MNDNNIESRTRALLERVKSLWITNVITTDGFDRLIKKINDGDLEDTANLLSKIEIEYKKNININDNTNTSPNVDGHYGIEENQNKHMNDIISKINFFERENSILNMQKERSKEKNEKLTIENEKIRKITEQLVSENHIMKKNIDKIEKENIELKNKHQQSRIDEKIPDYVKDVSHKLDVADKYFSDMSRNWSIAGLILALCAVASAFCTFIFGLDTILDSQKLTPTAIIYTFVRGGLGIALLSWVSYISFSNARNYTHESILRKDRQHALTFGRLFLQIYGSTASKEDAIHVFKDWNMSGDTAFSSKSSTPPSPLSYIHTVKNALSKTTSTTKNVDKANE
ncbi:TPA: hypothetical protein ACKP06_000763 [Serratia marcescens]